MMLTIPKLLRRRKVIFDKQPDHIFLMHEFGYKNMLDGVTYEECLHYLGEHGIFVDAKSVRDLTDLAFGEVFILNFDGSLNTVKQHSTGKHYMTSAAYYRYLEYVELAEARKSSREARVWSIIALGMSVLLAAIQVWAQIISAK